MYTVHTNRFENKIQCPFCSSREGQEAKEGGGIQQMYLDKEFSTESAWCISCLTAPCFHACTEGQQLHINITHSNI